jgi:hypothetical protein
MLDNTEMNKTKNKWFLRKQIYLTVDLHNSILKCINRDTFGVFNKLPISIWHI